MNFFRRLKFKTQILICFAIVICFVAIALFAVAQTILRESYRELKNNALENYSQQLSKNISNQLDSYLSYMQLLSSDTGLLKAMATSNLKDVERYLNQSVEDYLKNNMGRVNSIRVYQRNTFSNIFGLGPTGDVFSALAESPKQYPENIYITGTYLNARNEKVFSIFRKVYQQNMDREYCIEMCVYETEIFRFYNENADGTDIYIFNDDALLSCNDRQSLTELLFYQHSEKGEVVSKEDLTLGKRDVVVDEIGSFGIGIHLETDLAYLDRDYMALVLKLAPIIILIFFISFQLVAMISRQMNRRVKTLQEKIQTISANDMNEPIHLEGEDEFSMLAVQMEDMRQRILDLIDQSTKAQEQQRIAEMSALRAQINSHFLFNSLSTIKWLALEGKVGQQAKAVDSLAQFLRYSLEITGNQVALEEEIRQLRAYVYLQSLRYGDEINVQIDVDEALMKCQTVRLILQPLVENSIHHGRRDNGATLNITIYSDFDEDYYYLMVEDDGNGIEARTLENLRQGRQDNSQSGYGLSNVIDRLHICLKDRSDDVIRIDSCEGSYTIVTIRQPLIM